MNPAGTDAIGMLRWGLWRYRWAFLACVLLATVLAPLLIGGREVPAEAKALVIAQRLDTDLSALPRFGEAIFNNGEITRALATTFGIDPTEDDIIPGRVALVTEQDSLVFQVIGRDADPAAAADIANSAAETFVASLNASGAGVGRFALQSTAVPPAVHEQSLLDAVYSVPIGFGAGLTLGLAVVCGLLVGRRPVVDGRDAEEMTGVASLGTVAVPRTRGDRFARPEEFDGLVPVCRRLLGLPTPTVVLVSRPRDEQVRIHLAVALVGMLRLVGRVQFIGSPALSDADGRTVLSGGGAADARAAADGEVRSDEPGRPAARITVIDGGDLLTLVQPPASTATVLVVPEGISSATLRAAVVEHLGGSAEVRLLMVRRGRRTRGRSLTEVSVPGAVPAGGAGAPVR